MVFPLVGLILGGLAGFFIGRLWAAGLAILAPLPWYLGIAFGLWGSGFGDSWEYTIPIWVVPVCLGFIIGAMARRGRGRRLQGGDAHSAVARSR